MLQYYSLVLLILVQAAIIFLNGAAPRKRMLFCVLSGAEIAAVIGLRSINVGIDTFSYAQRFSEISYVSFFSLFSLDIHFEKGFLLYNKVLSFISYNPQVLFIVSAIILMWAVMRLIYKNTSFVWLGTIIYISAVGDFRWALTATRQTIAIAFTVFAFEAVKKRRPLNFILFVLIAAMFHKSALCFLILYPLYRVRFNIVNVFIALAGSVIIFFNLGLILHFASSLFPNYQGYLSVSGLDSITGVLIKVLIAAFPVLILHLTRSRADKDMNVLLWSALLSLLFAVFTLKLYMLGRLALYFSIYTIILVPKTFELIKNKKAFIFFLAIFLGCTLLYTQRTITHGAKDNNFLPYEFFWQNESGARRWNFTDSYTPW